MRGKKIEDRGRIVHSAQRSTSNHKTTFEVNHLQATVHSDTLTFFRFRFRFIVDQNITLDSTEPYIECLRDYHSASSNRNRNRNPHQTLIILFLPKSNPRVYKDQY